MNSVLSSIRKRCSDAIRRGAPMYNKGNIAECERIYMNLRQEIISDCEKNFNSPNQDQPPDYELLKTYDIMKGIKLKPSDRSNETRSNTDQNAWALRRGLDEILVNLEQYNEPESQPNFDMRPMIKREIQNAISKGAPMYNEGNIVGCEKLYMNLLTEMLNPSNVNFSNLDSNLPKVHEHLLNTKRKLVKSDNSNQRNSMTDKNAWTLRHCLDTILKMETGESSCGSGVTRITNKILLDLKTPGVSILNDGVMGGVSTSIWQGGVFSGKVRLDNNGGFASLRHPFQTPMNLSQFDGFYISAKNMLGSQFENQEFCLIIKDSKCMQSMATNFKMKFTPTTGKGISRSEHTVSAKVLNQPESFGRPRRDQWNCDMKQICEIGVMAIKPGVIGDFKIMIFEIGVFKQT